jgi:hypothetical protein
MNKIVAVLTGDLVQSSRLSSGQLDQVRHIFDQTCEELMHFQPGLLPAKIDFFRGDAWQLLLTNPLWALRAAIFLRASLLMNNLADTRVVIGLGTTENINTKRISLSTGQAFTLSGRELDKLTQYFRMSIAIPQNVKILASWLALIGQLCDILISHWTRRQAHVIRLALAPDNPTHAAIADRLSPSVSKQAVTSSLAGADWHGLRTAIRQFEKTDWEKLLSSF